MSSEAVKAIEDLGRSFEAFKSENDKRLSEIEKNGHAPADLEEKVERINNELTVLQNVKDRMDAMEAAASRPGFGGASGLDKAKAEHRKAFMTFMRTGEEGNLVALAVQAALTTQSDPDGGYITAPAEVDTEIMRIMGNMSAMRGLATIRPVGASSYKKPVNVGGASSGWVGEEQDRPETNTPQIKILDFPTKELYAEPHATQGMLDDASFDLDGWLSDEVALEFAEKEGGAFITGAGVNDPRGILSYTAVANASYSWGKLGYIASGAAGAWAASNPSDKLIDLVHALKAGYRNGAAFLMNDTTLGSIRKFKDGNGQYLWRPGLSEGEPETLLGKRVAIDDNMPDIAANSLSIAFGDFRRGYVITDRMGVRVLRDAFTNKPFIKFYTTKRVGGGVQNFEAIKLMRFSAS